MQYLIGAIVVFVLVVMGYNYFIHNYYEGSNIPSQSDCYGYNKDPVTGICP